jgi:hypothetical protein
MVRSGAWSGASSVVFVDTHPSPLNSWPQYAAKYNAERSSDGLYSPIEIRIEAIKQYVFTVANWRLSLYNAKKHYMVVCLRYSDKRYSDGILV